MSFLRNILAAEPEPPSPQSTPPPPPPPPPPNPEPDASFDVMPPPPPTLPKPEEQAGDEPKEDGQDDPPHTSTTATTRRNPSGSVSSVYSGNKIKHLKKEDGIPLWRKDIQYDFLQLVFYDPTRCFTKYSDGSKGWTFAEAYIDAMAKSSKCSKILKEKLLQDTEGAISMAMVCLLVNVGRMNTTLNFFPEMRAQLRTYHSIPALQAHQDPNAYKQLQDAPRLKSILKGATEDDPQPSTMEEVRARQRPRTNPVNLIFVMSQYAPKISETHFNPPRDFFDLVMRGSLSSASRARAFLWLIWWYLESDFGYEDSQSNPFGKGQLGDSEEGTDVLPLKVPTLESLTEEQAALENVDTEEEERFGEVKRKERIAILASEPSPAMTALKRARKEKGLFSARDGGRGSDDESTEACWPRNASASASGRLAGVYQDNGSEYTRSPTPPISRGFQAVNAPLPAGGMRINNVLNDDPPEEVQAAPSGSGKKGPGRGNWQRNRTKQETVPLAVRGAESSHHVPLLPNTGQLNFINETPHAAPLQPATPNSSAYGAYANTNANGTAAAPSHLSPPQPSLSFPPHSTRDHHIPTPSYQSQKRNRGVTQHQSALLSHRRQQIDWMLERRLRRVHARAREAREAEGAVLRAWKRVRMVSAEYDSEEEIIRARRRRGVREGGGERERGEKEGGAGEEGRAVGKGGGGAGGKEKEKEKERETLVPFDTAAEEADGNRRLPRVLFAGMGTMMVRRDGGGAGGDLREVGEEPQAWARTLRRVSRRLERWQEGSLPGQAMMMRRRQVRGGQGVHGLYYPPPLRRGGQVMREASGGCGGGGGGQYEGGQQGTQAEEYTVPGRGGGGGRQRSGTGTGTRRTMGEPSSAAPASASASASASRRMVDGQLDSRAAGYEEGYDDEGGGGEGVELDEEERELLGEVDADEGESEGEGEGEDEEMGEE
ncbi:hypothetical protein B0A55_08619 [Friedmanniomyces simplex]|uniref:Ino eighty subunit 1 n=1 Tax=Friedmanniomyces simplex TaxID=329884 RepID=A0A4U0WYS4_9PEZI|nr:hypothetical protein B0A55_08619 [Friedmanniomyces simplex]